MKIGISMLCTSSSIDPALLAQRAEQLGFDSFWLPEHPIIPVSVKTGFRGVPGQPIPEAYAHIIEPFTALAKAAGLTKTIKLGTGICLVPERNPILLAKQVASLDCLSGGRFIFGVGAGWLKEEIQIMGGNFEHRWGQTREAVRAMKELWTKDESEFHGKYYDFPPLKCFPKPVQKPHPPIFLGGYTSRVFARIAEWGDGWLADGSPPTPDQVKDARSSLDQLAVAAGRDPRSISIIVYTRRRDRDEMKRYQEAGADGMNFGLTSLPEKEALAELEQAAREVLPS